jgi:threonine synthase
LFSDKDFKEKYQLGAVNSINWARILAQTTYYFYSFFQVQKQVGKDSKVQYSVPSGNFGDALAGFYAKQMGLPIHRFIVATNENDILNRFFKTGVYDKQLTKEMDPVKQTLSPAMDILISSNFERLLWYLVQSGSLENNYSKNDYPSASAKINEYMTVLKNTGGFSVSDQVLERAKSLFVSHRVTDKETKGCINRYFHDKSFSMVIDPVILC